MNYTDEQLNAFLDEELSDTEMTSIRLALQTDLNLAERFEDISFADALVQSHCETIDAKPIPQNLVNLLSDNPFDIPINIFNNFRSSEIIHRSNYRMFSVVAIMFSLLSFVIYFSNQQNSMQMPIAKGIISTESRLHLALELTPSARSINLSQENDLFITPILTFKNQANQYCREFLVHSNKYESRTLACNDNGQWNVLINTQPSLSSTNNGYLTASGSSPRLFDRTIDQMILEDPLSSEEELNKIKSGWK